MSILQLLRNLTPLADFNAAKVKLESFSSNDRKDGELIACRYYDNMEVKSALGLYYVSGTTVKCTILKDVSSVEDDIENTIKQLVFNDSEVDGSIVVKVDQTDGIVKNTKKAIKDVKLIGYISQGETDSLQIAATDTVESAFGKVETYIRNLDYTSPATNGFPIVTIQQTNGKLSNIAAGSIYAKAVDLEDTGSVQAKTVQDAITEIAGKVSKNQVTNSDGTITVSTTGDNTDVKVNVKAGEKVIKVDPSKGGIYTNLNVVKVTDNLQSNVKEAYEVRDSDGNKIGDAINIYKDSSLLSVKLLHAKVDEKPTYTKEGGWNDITGGTEADLALCFAYETTNGTIIVEVVPVGNFLRESEFKDGLQVVGGEVSVKVKQNDKYLEVSADGVASKGIDDAIGTAIKNALGGETAKPVDQQIKDSIEALDSEKTSTDGKNVQVKVIQTDGKISTVNITTDNTASTTELTTEATARKTVTGVNADTYTAKADANYIQAATSLKDADEKLDAAIKTVSDKVGTDSVTDTIDNSLKKLTVGVKGGSGKFIQSIKQEDGLITAAEADLTATNVAATKLTGGTAETVQGILEELDARIQSAEGEAIGVEAGDGISITSGSEASLKKIAVKVKSTDTFLEATADGLGVKADFVLDLGTY